MSIFNKRENYRPFEYGHITDPLINAMWAGHWTVNEFSFSSDIQDFKTQLDDTERDLFKKTILLISQIEVAVKTYWSGIGRIFPKPEIGDMGAVFGGIEVIHSRAYSEILNKLGFNDDFQNILNKPAVRGRVAYLNKYNDKPYKNDYKNAIYSLTLFTLFVENVSLFSQFYIVLAFNRFRGILKDVANVVQYTSKEENLHAEGGIALINEIRKEHPELFDIEFETRIYEEANEALTAEMNLIEWILQDYSNEFLSKEILITYLKKRLNISLEKIGFEPIFEVDEKLVEQTDWMDDEVFASTLTDFFYKKPIEYQRKMKSFEASDLF
jgi:ribonucleoside-diphosphate reductase beta chain